MNSQGSIQLSEILDPSPPADKPAFPEALQIDQTEDRFNYRPRINDKYIRSFEVVVVNSVFVKRAEQSRQASQKTRLFT